MSEAVELRAILSHYVYDDKHLKGRKVEQCLQAILQVIGRRPALKEEATRLDYQSGKCCSGYPNCIHKPNYNNASFMAMDEQMDAEELCQQEDMTDLGSVEAKEQNKPMFSLMTHPEETLDKAFQAKEHPPAHCGCTFSAENPARCFKCGGVFWTLSINQLSKPINNQEIDGKEQPPASEPSRVNLDISRQNLDGRAPKVSVKEIEILNILKMEMPKDLHPSHICNPKSQSHLEGMKDGALCAMIIMDAILPKMAQAIARKLNG